MFCTSLHSFSCYTPASENPKIGAMDHPKLYLSQLHNSYSRATLIERVPVAG